jgi:predicted  nucleic acid-binding Zn-ribbon protein
MSDTVSHGGDKLPFSCEQCGSRFPSPYHLWGTDNGRWRCPDCGWTGGFEEWDDRDAAARNGPVDTDQTGLNALFDDPKPPSGYGREDADEAPAEHSNDDVDVDGSGADEYADAPEWMGDKQRQAWYIIRDYPDETSSDFAARFDEIGETTFDSVKHWMGDWVATDADLVKTFDGLSSEHQAIIRRKVADPSLSQADLADQLNLSRRQARYGLDRHRILIQRLRDSDTFDSRGIDDPTAILTSHAPSGSSWSQRHRTTIGTYLGVKAGGEYRGADEETVVRDIVARNGGSWTTVRNMLNGFRGSEFDPDPIDPAVAYERLPANGKAVVDVLVNDPDASTQTLESKTGYSRRTVKEARRYYWPLADAVRGKDEEVESEKAIQGENSADAAGHDRYECEYCGAVYDREQKLIGHFGQCGARKQALSADRPDKRQWPAVTVGNVDAWVWSRERTTPPRSRPSVVNGENNGDNRQSVSVELSEWVWNRSSVGTSGEGPLETSQEDVIGYVSGPDGSLVPVRELGADAEWPTESPADTGRTRTAVVSAVIGALVALVAEHAGEIMQLIQAVVA